MLRLLVAMMIIFLTTIAVAQNKPLACQVDAHAGLDWENGRWKTKNFTTKRFILVQSGDTLTLESVAKALGNSSTLTIKCDNSLEITCNDIFGSHLIFHLRTLKGALTHTFGATQNGNERDSVAVGVFSCTPF